MPENFDELTALQAQDLLDKKEEVDSEVVNKLAEKFSDNSEVIYRCLLNGYNPENVQGEVLKNCGVAFLKYRESLKMVLSSSLSYDEKIAKIEELKASCGELFHERFETEPELKESFGGLFAAAEENARILGERAKYTNYYNYTNYFSEREARILTDAQAEERRSKIDFNDELIQSLESSYIAYNDARTEAAVKLSRFNASVDATKTLDTTLKKDGSELVVDTDAIREQRAKAEKITRYFKLQSAREHGTLSSAEEKEMQDLINSGIEEITKVEAAYQAYINNVNRMYDFFEKYEATRIPADLDKLRIPHENTGLSLKREPNPLGDKAEDLEPDKDEEMTPVPTEDGKSVGVRLKKGLIDLIGGILGATGLFYVYDAIMNFFSGIARRYKEGAERLEKAFGLKQDDEEKEDEDTLDKDKTKEDETPTSDRSLEGDKSLDSRRPEATERITTPVEDASLDGERTVVSRPREDVERVTTPVEDASLDGERTVVSRSREDVERVTPPVADGERMVDSSRPEPISRPSVEPVEARRPDEASSEDDIVIRISNIKNPEVRESLLGALKELSETISGSIQITYGGSGEEYSESAGRGSR